MKRISIIAFLMLLFLSTGVSAKTNMPVYRLFNVNSGEHLYTPDYNEVSSLTDGWFWFSTGWKDEGLGWVEPKEGQGVYRLCNNKNGSHLYTTDTNEVSVLTSGPDWVSDFNGQPIFYSGGSTPVYRVYHPQTGQHHLTTDGNEYAILGAQGWNQEGQALNCAGTNYASAVIVDNVLANPQSGWSKLNDQEKDVYAKMCVGVENLENVSLKEFGILEDQYGRIEALFTKDHPEYLQLEIITGNTYDPETGVILSYQPSYRIKDKETLNVKNQELDNWVNQGLSRLTPDMSESEKALVLLDYLHEKVKYPANDANTYSIYSDPVLHGIENNLAVCEGFTKLYQILLNRAGIFCTYYSGYTTDRDLNMGHVWNLAQLDGEYGWIDATWGRDYFGMSTEKRLKGIGFDKIEPYENYPKPSWGK